MITVSNPPAGLAEPGQAFWTEVHRAYELDARDAPVLLETCRVLDEIESLRAAIATDGVITKGSMGQPVEHPAMAGLRAHRLTLDRLLVRLALPSIEGDTPLTVTQIRAQKAAGSRWREHRTDVARRVAGGTD